MKEELLQKALSYVEDLETFVTGQLPPFVNEILNYALFENLIYLLVTCAGSGIFFGLWWRLWTPENRDFTDNNGDIVDIAKFFKCIFASISLFVSVCIFSHSLSPLMLIGKIYLAPRLFVIEYLSELMK
jgi:hypothetical protein